LSQLDADTAQAHLTAHQGQLRQALAASEGV
jgi:N-acetylmuramic acid 6-phosphate (MurNAc-6-P) etherase